MILKVLLYALKDAILKRKSYQSITVQKVNVKCAVNLEEGPGSNLRESSLQSPKSVTFQDISCVCENFSLSEQVFHLNLVDLHNPRMDRVVLQGFSLKDLQPCCKLWLAQAAEKSAQVTEEEPLQKFHILFGEEDDIKTSR